MKQQFYSSYYELEDRHWWFLGRRRILLSVLAREFGAADGDRDRKILDVGSGTGTMVRELARFGTAVGVDADAQAVALSRTRGVDVRLAQGERLPFEDASFDLVTAFDVLEHADDDLAMARELNRVLRPAGTLLVSVPAYRWMWGPQDEISEHRRRYVRPMLQRRLALAGFSVQRATYFNTLLFPTIAGVRLLRGRRPVEDDLRSDFEVAGGERLNSALARIFSLEAPLLQRIDFPFGVSILALARKPRDREAPS